MVTIYRLADLALTLILLLVICPLWWRTLRRDRQRLVEFQTEIMAALIGYRDELTQIRRENLDNYRRLARFGVLANDLSKEVEKSAQAANRVSEAVDSG